MDNPMATPNGQLPDPDQPQAQATLPPQPMQQAPVVQQNAQPQPVQPTPEQATAAHDSMIGRAFKVLSGQNTQYQVDPTTGRTIATQSQNTPGQFFKNIVAAALVGGAAGADNANTRTAGSGLASAMKGGTAVIDRDKQLDQERVQRAQQEYQNELTAQKNQREQSEEGRQVQNFQNQQVMFKAQMANSNLQTLKLQQELRGSDFGYHQEVANAGKVKANVYLNAGIKPITEIPESEVPDFVANRKGSSTDLDWVATDTKPITHPDGTVSYESIMSAFPKSEDPSKKQFTVTKNLLDDWKKNGMDKYHPELFNNLKVGKDIDGTQFAALTQRNEELISRNLSKQKLTADIADVKSQVQLRAADAAKAYADAAKTHAEISEAALGKKKDEQFNSAMQELNTTGDITKIKPSSRLIISESAPKLLQQYNEAAKNAIAAGETDLAKEYLGQISNIGRITASIFAPPTQAGVAPNPNEPQVVVTLSNGKTGRIPQSKLDDFIKANPGAKAQQPKPTAQQIIQEGQQSGGTTSEGEPIIPG